MFKRYQLSFISCVNKITIESNIKFLTFFAVFAKMKQCQNLTRPLTGTLLLCSWSVQNLPALFRQQKGYRTTTLTRPAC